MSDNNSPKSLNDNLNSNAPYIAHPDFDTLVMNDAIETMLTHRSQRDYTDEPISDAMLETILQAGRIVSTSNYMHSASIVRITDPELREKFRQVSNGMSEEEYNQAKRDGKKIGHEYVETAAEYFVFCMDNVRHENIEPDGQYDWAEVTILGAVDAAIMAQNMLIAAESLGLGGTFVGSMRNDIARAGELINAPKNLVPLFGLCLGHPTDAPINANQKPKLPLSVLVSENQYQPASDEQIDDFNTTVKGYYEHRGDPNHQGWRAQVTKTFIKEVRPQVMPYLNKQGFNKR